MKQATAVIAAVLSCAFVTSAVAGPRTVAQDQIVEEVRFTGNRRIPDDSMRLWVQTREGDTFSRDQASHDLRTILAQGYFEDAKVFTEDGPRGGVVVIFEVVEYPLILEVDYPGLKSVSASDVLEEWRKRSIGLSKESQFDPVKAKRAAAAIQDLLARKGRPNAKVTPEPEEISPTAVALHFRTDEGDRVRVAEIDFTGNQAFSDGELRSQMKLVKEAGLISGLTSKDIYDKDKIRYDLFNVTRYYWAHGYLAAKVGDPVVTEDGKVGSGVPLVGGKDSGLVITVPVEEGRVYRVRDVTVTGATVYPESVVRQVAGLVPGEVLDLPKVQKALDEDLKHLYGDRGYINFAADVTPTMVISPTDPGEGLVDVAIQLDEGKSFTVGRIEFKGNTYTRDKTIRRELALTEGEPYNQRYFDLSLLRLNQLDIFKPVAATDADIRTNIKTSVVDLDIRVEEKGRQQVQFSAGGAGVGGSFYGLQYSTNNLLGYGESLTFDVQAGARTKQFSFGFTEPYVLDRPVSAGFQLFYQDLQYLNTGTTSPNDVLFTRRTAGGSLAFSAPLSTVFHKSAAARFARLGLSYTYRTSSIADPAATFATDPTGTLALSYAQPDVVQSTLTPTFLYSTVDGGLDPTRGQQLSLGVAVSGGPVGGDVRTIQPTLEYRYFQPIRLLSKRDNRPDVFAVRVSAGHVRAFGDAVETNSLSFVGGAPFLSRYFLGGEDTIRGYGVGEIAPRVPVEQFLDQSNVMAVTLGGRTLDVASPRDANRGTVAPGPIRKLTYDMLPAGTGLAEVGGDSQLLMNLEYRVPLAGPFSVAAFADVGSVFDARPLRDQTTRTSYPGIPVSGLVIVNPRGQFATPAEIIAATTPETPPGALYPPGFRGVEFLGDRDVLTTYRLSRAADGLRDNLRSTLGAELRVQLPVVNLPVRLILGYNPNEGRTVFRFAVGRTF